MDVTRYFTSVSEEIGALQNRVRHLLADRHWQTDGEWIESVIRSVLRRHLPASVLVSRGFVIAGNDATTQIDVLIHDGSKPVLFKDGDLVFVTPDAVRGIVEVKSRVTVAEFGRACVKLSQNIELVRRHPNSKAFSGLFAFDSAGGAPNRHLRQLVRACSAWNGHINFAAIGSDRFMRYWNETPTPPHRMYSTWHSYDMPGLARGYFVNNVVDAISPESVFRNSEVWFPGSKEPYLDGEAQAQWAVADGA
jgi:hypothetical protein